jgi:hypothetical protein
MSILNRQQVNIHLEIKLSLSQILSAYEVHNGDSVNWNLRTQAHQERFRKSSQVDLHIQEATLIVFRNAVLYTIEELSTYTS